jgi:predicted CXXCH cytochrome family protein
MPEWEFRDSGTAILKPPRAGEDLRRGKRSRTALRSARVLAMLALSAALFGGWGMLSAQEPDKQDLTGEPEVIPHEPLDGRPCVECHEQSVPANVRCLIAGEQMCVLCHIIPAAGGPASLAEPSAELCFKCHDNEEFKGDFTHGPVASGDCLTCHSPHGDGNFPMVRITGRQMCLTCHEEMQSTFTKARFQHRAIVADGCTDCHSPHASDKQYQLTQSVPDVCFKCHEDIFKNVETAAVTHSPVTEDAACLNCHNPHLSNVDRLLSEEDMNLCLNCHSEPIEVDQRELTLMGKLLEENPLHHGPIQFGECSACHNPHGSPYFRLLTDMYPEKLYAPFFESNYALCFRCHDPGLAKEERTETLTDFRDGDRSLHYVHVNKTSMGRTCALCHGAHAGTNPKYIQESVPFGTWDLPIKFKMTENGGSCEPGCHAPKSYDRLAPKSDNP